MSTKTKKVGVCLSGGGIRSVAHLGALQALEESGYEVSEVVGVSGGALVTALYTHGYSIDELINISYKLNWLTFPFINLAMKHFLKGKTQLIPGYVTYTLMNGTTITDLPNAESVTRSCRIPGFLAIDGKYMDGCISNNYPMHVLSTKEKLCFNAVNRVHPEHTFSYFRQLSYVNDMYVLQKCPHNAVDLITEYVDPLKFGKKAYDRLIEMGYYNTMKRISPEGLTC